MVPQDRLSDIAQWVDAQLDDRVLIFGSLPPVARDLDLVARPLQIERLKAALHENGWFSRGAQWVRFAGCDVDAVDVVPVADWNLPPASAERLFEQAASISDYVNLAAPAPHHQVLILARRIGEGRGPLTAKRRARLEAAIAADSHVWEKAAAEADGWAATTALDELRSLFEGKRRAVPRSRRLVARAERHRSGGAGAIAAHAQAATSLARRPRGKVIAVSGIDGSGKSTQVAHLQEALVALGYPTHAAWARLGVDPSLDRFAAPVKAIVRKVRRRDGDLTPLKRSGDAATTAPAAGSNTDPGARRVLTFGWSVVVAALNAVVQRRNTQKHVRAGEIVICDRYTLDSLANLRYLYGEDRTYMLHRWILRVVSPRPVVSFFLDVPGAVAHERKPVKYTPQELEHYARLYREGYQKEGAVRVDGQKPPEELCETLAEAAWKALG